MAFLDEKGLAYFYDKLKDKFSGIDVFKGAASNTAGGSGTVPAPAAGDESKLLQGDGNWVSDIKGNAATATLANKFAVRTDNITSTTDDTPANWAAKGPGTWFYGTAGQLNGQPSQWGHLFNMCQGTAEVSQMWIESNSANVYIRGGNASGWLKVWTKINGTGAQSTCYTIPGTYTWTCPAGITMILVTVIGAGGGGGSGYALTSNKCAGGGGGGNIIRDYPYPVTPGANYTVIIGAGGSGCKAPNNMSENTSFTASAGGSSSFDSLTAFGGNYGKNQSGPGGVGGLSLGYDSTLDAFRTLNDGGNGGSYDNIHGHGGGQFGGTCGTNTSAATNGGLGSGGGGGSCRDGVSATYRVGGNGGPGMVMLVY